MDGWSTRILHHSSPLCSHSSGVQQNPSPKAPWGPPQSPRGCQEPGEGLETNLNCAASLSDPHGTVSSPGFGQLQVSSFILPP